MATIDNEKLTYTIVWCADDLRDLEPTLTDDEIRQIFKGMSFAYGCNVDWEVIEALVDDVMAFRRFKTEVPNA